MASDSQIQALQLAIEHNMETRGFKNQCVNGQGIFGNKYDRVTAVLILVPINKEILDAAISYKSSTEGLNDKSIKELIGRNYKVYLNGESTTFVLLVKANDNFDDDDHIYFEDLNSNIYLYDEFKNKYELTKYTRLFDEHLSPGWSKGYLYFNNFRTVNLNSFSYSVHFSNFILNACTSKKNHSKGSYKWAFSFDESEIRFLSLIEKGLPMEKIRSQYSISTYSNAGISSTDIFSIIGTILNVISIIK